MRTCDVRLDVAMVVYVASGASSSSYLDRLHGVLHLEEAAFRGEGVHSAIILRMRGEHRCSTDEGEHQAKRRVIENGDNEEGSWVSFIHDRSDAK